MALTFDFKLSVTIRVFVLIFITNSFVYTSCRFLQFAVNFYMKTIISSVRFRLLLLFFFSLTLSICDFFFRRHCLHYLFQSRITSENYIEFTTKTAIQNLTASTEAEKLYRNKKLLANN